MIACLGDDAFGAELRAALRSDGIDDSHVSTVGGSAPVWHRSWSMPVARTHRFAAGATTHSAPAYTRCPCLDEQARIIVLKLETPLPTIHYDQAGASAGKTVVLNPAAQVLP